MEHIYLVLLPSNASLKRAVNFVNGSHLPGNETAGLEGRWREGGLSDSPKGHAGQWCGHGMVGEPQRPW